MGAILKGAWMGLNFCGATRPNDERIRRIVVFSEASILNVASVLVFSLDPKEVQIQLECAHISPKPKIQTTGFRLNVQCPTKTY